MGLGFVGSDASWSYSGFYRFCTKLAFASDAKPSTCAGGEDPILILTEHSDCDGIISPADCARIAPRLRELMADWLDEDYDKEHGILLAEGMEECARSNKDLIFC
jgi:hypothetical protein